MVSEALKKAYKFLASTELAVALFLIICIAAIPGTFLEKREVIYHNPFFLALLVMLGVNLVLCTVYRFRSISKPVLVLHCGVLITLAGCVMTALGFVATVNMYEGTMTDQAYRWDLDRDVPLGVELTVRKINREFYPIPVKVGVLRGTEKVGLHTLKTGESFSFDGYTVKAGELEFPGETLKLSIFRDGVQLGTSDTAGASALPPGFPYQFKLVAFMNPVLKRLWVDIALARQALAIEGTAEVNSPFSWEGLYFYNTQVARDDTGRPYAGIQVVRDPGRPYVFAGFAVTCIGATLCFARRFFRKKHGID